MTGSIGRHRRSPEQQLRIGFAAAHLLPHWSSFSDSFTGSHVGPNVTVLSWATALFEIGADIAFGCAGVRVLGTSRRTAVQ
jgi:hypothetical protein